jgi:high-affinity iron transporter
MTTVFWRTLSDHALLSLICLLCSVRLAGAQDVPEQTQFLLHLLDYVAVDYPGCVQDGTVLDQAEYDEQVEFSQQVRLLLDQFPAHADKPGLLDQTEQLVGLIQDKRPGLEVAALAQQLRWNIIHAYKVEVAPHRPPDLHSGAALYQTYCLACHGPQGYGDGPAGANLDPTPSNFHDHQRLDQRSIYGLYRTITLGVPGTGMASFRTLSEDERWALAFYISNFAGSEADIVRGTALWQSGVRPAWLADLTSVATATVNEVNAVHGADGVRVLAYLRRHPEAIVAAVEAPLARSARLLRESLAAYRRGQVQAAQELCSVRLLPLDPVRFPAIPALGIYPNLLGLVPGGPGEGARGLQFAVVQWYSVR